MKLYLQARRVADRSVKLERKNNWYELDHLPCMRTEDVRGHDVLGPQFRIKSIIKMADRDRKADDDGNDGSSGTGVATQVKPKTKKPSLYRVLLLNDDFTPMEFVVHVLERFFSKSGEQATRIMLHVHNHGVGECGVFTFEVAETKVTQVMDFARKHQHPLQCVMEKK